MHRRAGRAVTSFDVARAAGVSQPTVSRAMRGLPSVSVATRDRVRAAARELGYVPSDAGRALATRSTRRVAIVAEELTNPYYPELVEPLRAALADRGLRTVLVADGADDALMLDALTDGSYDGVILATVLRTSSLPHELTQRGVPHVQVNRVVDRATSPYCAFDNAAGARAVAALLTDLGHRRIASLQGPIVTSTGRERASALAAALRAKGVPRSRALHRRVAFDHDAAYAAALELLAPEPGRPTAVACGNDVIALGVLSAARHLGLDVPLDLTVVGFDDIPMAGWPLVALTTVRCDRTALAALAVRMLECSLGAPPGGLARTPTSALVATHLVLRGTHGVPRA